jgi:hypothetical protein
MTPDNETRLLTRQIIRNNNYINSLLYTTEMIQRDTSDALARLRELNRTNQNILDSNVLFYVYTHPDIPSTPTVPTNEIIESETTVRIFETIESPLTLQCPISQEYFESQQSVTMINHCRHIFNTIDLLRWFQSNSTCPVCRYNICNREEYREPDLPDPPRENPRENIFNVIGNIANIASRVVNVPVNNVDDMLDMFREGNISNIINQLREPR